MPRKPAAKAKVVTQPAPVQLGVYDSLFSTVAPLAGAQKGFGDELTPGYRLTPWQIEEAMMWDGVMDTYVNRPAEDMLANGITYLKLKDTQKTQVDTWLSDRGFMDALVEAYQAMDRTGFGAMWINTGSLDNSKPLRPGELRRCKEFIVFDADQLHADKADYSVSRKPKTWRVTANDAEIDAPRIHESRLLILRGESPSPRRRYQDGGKGVPKPCKVWQAWCGWRKVNLTAPQIAEVFEEPTLYIEGLNKKLGTPNGSKEIKARATDFAMTRNALRLAVMDATERYERTAPPIQGLSDIYDQSAEFFLAQTGWPRSILFGSLKGGSLGGEGASTGEEQEWAKLIARLQKKWLFPLLTRLFKLLKADVFKRFDFAFEFPPLHQQTEAEWEQIATSQNARLVAAKNAGLLKREEARQIGKDLGLYPNINPAEPPDEPVVDPNALPGEGKPGDKLAPDDKPDPKGDDDA